MQTQRTIRPWQESFWVRVDRSGGPDACWPWLGNMGRGRHGLFSSQQLTPKTQQAHVLAWKLLRGAVPPGAWLCHDCPGGERPDCVNPAHLYAGTAKTNAADRDRNGRTARGDAHYARRQPERLARGERHGRTTVNESQVREMRARAARGISFAAIAQQYGLATKTAWNIIRRKTWCHI